MLILLFSLKQPFFVSFFIASLLFLLKQQHLLFFPLLFQTFNFVLSSFAVSVCLGLYYFSFTVRLFNNVLCIFLLKMFFCGLILYRKTKWNDLNVLSIFV